MAFRIHSLAAAAIVAASMQAHAGINNSMGTAVLSTADIVPNIVAGGPPDTPAAHVDPNTSTSAFSGVVSINIRYHDPVTNAGLSYICSGTLVSSFHVVSAGHCVDTTGNGDIIQLGTPYTATSGADVRVVFNSNGSQNAVIQASAVSMNPNYQGFGNCPAGSAAGLFCVNDDISVITLSAAAPTTAKQYRVWGGNVSGANGVTMVGYGTSGTGTTGFTVSPSFTVKRQGQNTMEVYDRDDEGFFQNGGNEIWYADFDGPGVNQNLFCNSNHAGDWGYACGPSLPNAQEANIGGGDSGGAAFFNVGGEYILAGNTTFGGTYDDQTGGTFGTYFGGMLTGTYASYLRTATNNSIQFVGLPVPEPETYAMMLLGMAGIGAIVRRRRAQQA